MIRMFVQFTGTKEAEQCMGSSGSEVSPRQDAFADYILVVYIESWLW
jgi:hypothetical protein